MDLSSPMLSTFSCVLAFTFTTEGSALSIRHRLLRMFSCTAQAAMQDQHLSCHGPKARQQALTSSAGTAHQGRMLSCTIQVTQSQRPTLAQLPGPEVQYNALDHHWTPLCWGTVLFSDMVVYDPHDMVGFDPPYGLNDPDLFTQHVAISSVPCVVRAWASVR
jgi:hypothetical protein